MLEQLVEPSRTTGSQGHIAVFRAGAPFAQVSTAFSYLSPNPRVIEPQSRRPLSFLSLPLDAHLSHHESRDSLGTRLG